MNDKVYIIEEKYEYEDEWQEYTSTMNENGLEVELQSVKHDMETNNTQYRVKEFRLWNTYPVKLESTTKTVKQKITKAVIDRRD